MSVITLKKEDFNTEVMNCEKPVLIDFFATWCGPCKMVSPIIEEIEENREDIKVCKVDVDEEPELAQSFGIESIPTLVVIKNGKIINQKTGYLSKEDILKLLEQ